MGQEDPLKKEMAIHSSILAWEIPWTEEPGGLESMGRKELDITEYTHTHTHTHTHSEWSTEVRTAPSHWRCLNKG